MYASERVNMAHSKQWKNTGVACDLKILQQLQPRIYRTKIPPLLLKMLAYDDGRWNASKGTGNTNGA